MEIARIKPGFFNIIKNKFVTVTDEATFSKEVSFAIQAFNKNNYLQGCDTESKLSAVLNICQIGLTLNPALKLAYLVPRNVKGVRICCLEPSYQGLVKLITDTGSAKNVYAHIVYKGDEFEELLGTTTELVHRPKRQSTEIELAYAVAVLADGSKQIEVMTIKEIDEIMEKSESYKSYKDPKVFTKSCIWVDYKPEMCRKTVIKRLTKYLPKTNQWEKVAKATELLDSDWTITTGQEEYINGLLRPSALDEKQRTEIELELGVMNGDRAKEVIEYLKENQANAVESGHGYGMKDIDQQLDRHVG